MKNSNALCMGKHCQQFTKILNKIFISSFLLAFCFPLNAKQVEVDDVVSIALWNGYPQGPHTAIFLATGGSPENNGLATLTRDAAGTGYTVNTDGVASSTGWQNAETIEKYWITSFSTLGFENLTVTSKQMSSGMGPRDFKIQYKVGASGTWTDVDDGEVLITSSTTYTSTGVKENLPLPKNMNNKEEVLLRWLCTSNVSQSGATVSTGTNRLDVTVYGEPASTIGDPETPPTLCPEHVFDPANNIIYNVVELEGKCWFKENLRNTKYQNNTEIPFAEPYYRSFYPDVEQNTSNFGLLYTYESAVPISTTLCPTGWRIPTAAEWEELNIYEITDMNNHDYWLHPNVYTNTTAFDIRGAGFFNSFTQQFEKLYGYTAFWSSNSSSETAIAAVLKYFCNQLEIMEVTKMDGISVRCIQE
ncbi:MAG: fibrobacter succinogenes major paralogous domain-containing protein [Lentimicrobiaceae bacterium]|nr:fibrobacter succinogenes major paralogous domain-containing protein [Lentimicrobiaceae bacterium]